MGYAISWMAVSGISPARAMEMLGVEGTGVMEEFPESPLAWATLPNGWSVLVAQVASAPMIERAVSERLSQGGTVITGVVEEHVMYSEASGYVAGQRVWHVSHTGDSLLSDLEVDGTLPPEFDAINAECRALQAAEDIGEMTVDYLFEIPVLLVERLTSFRYDVDTPVSFEVLDKATTSSADASKPWWRIW